MRLGVLDVGSNTVHLLVVDAHRGGHPDPTCSEKTQLRLAEHLAGRRLTAAGAGGLVDAVARAKAVATAAGCQELLAFATSALRDADNSAAVLSQVQTETGVGLQVLSGEDEARYTFLAVRRWYGWSAGRLLVLDIGGGSLELAAGRDEDPEVALSLPLGAGRLTRQRLTDDPPARRDVEALAEDLDVALAPVARQISGQGHTTSPSAHRRHSAHSPDWPGPPRPAPDSEPVARSPMSGCASCWASSAGWHLRTWRSWTESAPAALTSLWPARWWPGPR